MYFLLRKEILHFEGFQVHGMVYGQYMFTFMLPSIKYICYLTVPVHNLESATLLERSVALFLS